MNLNYVKEIAKWMQSDRPVAEIREELLNYHDRDIAFAIESLDGAARKKAFQIMDEERLADVFSYFKNPLEYMDEIGMERFAAIVSDMDSDGRTGRYDQKASRASVTGGCEEGDPADPLL